LCGIQIRKKIESNVIDEINKKIDTLKKPKNRSNRPILIYEGEISPSMANRHFF